MYEFLYGEFTFPPEALDGGTKDASAEDIEQELLDDSYSMARIFAAVSSIFKVNIH